MEQSRVHYPGGFFLPGHPGHVIRCLHLRPVSRHTRGQVLQSGTLLHHPRWNLPGLYLSLHPHRPPHGGFLLPPEAPRGALRCHVLLCPCHQNQSHRSDSGGQQKEDLHQETEVHERLGSGGHRLRPDQSTAQSGGHPHRPGAS